MRISVIAGLLGISPATLRRWEKAGLIPPVPRMGLRGERRYTEADLQHIRRAICGISRGSQNEG